MENKEPITFEITRRFPFYDLDPIQVVWHGNYMNYFEDARVALLGAHGIDLYQIYQRTGIVFPSSDLHEHILPLRNQDEFVCRAMSGSPFQARLRFRDPAGSGRSGLHQGPTEQVR